MRRLSSLAVAISLLFLLPSTWAIAPEEDDDAGSGRDAPNTPVPDIVVQPGIVYEGRRLGVAAGDPSDHYAFYGDAGRSIHAIYAGAAGQLNVLDATGAPLDARTPAATLGYTIGAEYEGVLPTTGLYFLRISYSTPDAYGFSFALDARAPWPGAVPPAFETALGLLGSERELPPVAGASVAGPHVVVAVVDTGINPYHAFFREANLTAHPSTYVDGFPATAQPVALTLDAPSYQSAMAADGATWDALEYSARVTGGVFDEHVYTFPGTRVIAGVSFGEFDSPIQGGGGTRAILDEHGHGTGSAGLAAGSGLDLADANVLIVAVEVGGGSFGAGIRWAAEQEWIDIITVSMGKVGNVPVGTEHQDSWHAFARGAATFVAAGNGFSGTGLSADHCSTHTSPITGPSWVTRIGAAEPETGNPTTWHCLPVDAIAKTPWPSAAGQDMVASDAHTGTSAATPNVAGHLAQLLLDARRAGLDPTPLDARDHLLRAARPAEPSPALLAEPSLPLVSILDQGYGLVDGAALARARETLLQGAPPTSRPIEDEFFAVDRAARDVLWPPPQPSQLPAQDDAGSGHDAPGGPSAEIWIRSGVAYRGERRAQTEGDVSDHYAFQASAGDIVEARYAGAVGLLDIVDAQGQELNSGGASLGYHALPARTTATIPTDGTYFVRIGYLNDEIYGFSIGLNELAPAPDPLPPIPK